MSFRVLFSAAVAAIVLLSTPLSFAQEATTVGSLELSGGFTRATLPNAPVGGGFITITNKGATDDRLVSVTTRAADVGQLHEMAMDGDVMKMRALPDGVTIPAGESVTLSPGGTHMMFMGLKQAFVEGQTIAVTLSFEAAGTVTLDLPVLGAAADMPMSMDHGSH